MGKTSSSAKNNWAATHYTQIKIAVNPELAEKFKVLCRAENTTVTSELAGFMIKRCGESIAPRSPKKDPLLTRGGRRKLTNELILRLEEIKDAEAAYLSNIPENLQGSVNYEIAEECVSDLENVLDTLEGAFR